MEQVVRPKIPGIRMALFLLVAVSVTGGADASGWDKTISTSEFDDSKTVVLRLTADERISTGLYGYAVPTLVVRCLENTTALYVNFDTFLGIDDTWVEYRIDSQAAESARWNISTNHESVGLWRGNQSIPLIRRLLDKERFLLRLTPYGENPVVAKFSISGLRNEAQELAEACHWSMDVAHSTSDGQSHQVTATVIDAVRRQIEQRWLIPVGARDAENLRVTIQIRLAPDGRVLTAQVVDSASDAAVGGEFYRTAAESALRAVLYFQDRPLEGLPPDAYDEWRFMELKFDPSKVL